MVDYSVNSLMKNANSINIISIRREDAQLELNVLNQKFGFRLIDIDNQLEKLKQAFLKNPLFTIR